MLIIWVILGSIIFFYFTTILSLTISWLRVNTFNPAKTSHQTDLFISVVIALRNEEENLPALISSFKNQNFRPDGFEVILVNDHSTDNTFNLAKQHAEENNWLQLINLDDHLQGKKNAISKGISNAKGELLAFTDGDCTLSNNWLSALAAFYEQKNKPDLIIGLVDLQSNSLTQNLFRLDFLSLILSGAGAAGFSNPIYCNAANMAVKKLSITNISTRHNIVSGDDVFLLHEMKAQGNSIQLLKSPSHIVKTLAPKTLAEFYEQRKRWASKTKNYSDKTTLSIAILVFMANISYIASLALLFSTQHWLWLMPVILKFTSDFSLLLSGTRFFQYSKLLPLVPILSAIHPIYIVITALSSQKSPFVWKGRKYTG